MNELLVGINGHYFAIHMKPAHQSYHIELSNKN